MAVAKKAKPESKAKSGGLAEKAAWAKVNYLDKGKTRPEAIQGLISKFDMSEAYAKVVVYTHVKGKWVSARGGKVTAKKAVKKTARSESKVKAPMAAKRKAPASSMDDDEDFID